MADCFFFVSGILQSTFNMGEGFFLGGGEWRRDRLREGLLHNCTFQLRQHPKRDTPTPATMGRHIVRGPQQLRTTRGVRGRGGRKQAGNTGHGAQGSRGYRTRSASP